MLEQERSHRITGIIHDHQSFIIGVIRKKGLSPTDIEDALQRLWLILHQRFDRFESNPNSRAWLATTASNVCRNMLKAQRREQRLFDRSDSTVVDITEELVPQRADDRFERVELWARASGVLDCLPSEQREAFVLSRCEGLTIREIAARTGTSPPRVTTWLRTVRARLRAERRRIRTERVMRRPPR